MFVYELSGCEFECRKRILHVSRKIKDSWLSLVRKALFSRNIIKGINSGSFSWTEMNSLLVSLEIMMSDWME